MRLPFFVSTVLRRTSTARSALRDGPGRSRSASANSTISSSFSFIPALYPKGKGSSTWPKQPSERPNPRPALRIAKVIARAFLLFRGATPIRSSRRGVGAGGGNRSLALAEVSPMRSSSSPESHPILSPTKLWRYHSPRLSPLIEIRSRPTLSPTCRRSLPRVVRGRLASIPKVCFCHNYGELPGSRRRRGGCGAIARSCRRREAYPISTACRKASLAACVTLVSRRTDAARSQFWATIS